MISKVPGTLQVCRTERINYNDACINRILSLSRVTSVCGRLLPPLQRILFTIFSTLFVNRWSCPKRNANGPWRWSKWHLGRSWKGTCVTTPHQMVSPASVYRKDGCRYDNVRESVGVRMHSYMSWTRSVLCYTSLFRRVWCRWLHVSYAFLCFRICVP